MIVQATVEAARLDQLCVNMAVEAASGFGWAQYAGTGGAILAMQSFGASAPLQQLQQRYGFTVEHVVAVPIA